MDGEYDQNRAEWLWQKVSEYQSAEGALLRLLLDRNPTLWLYWHRNRDELIVNHNKELMSE